MLVGIIGGGDSDKSAGAGLVAPFKAAYFMMIELPGVAVARVGAGFPPDFRRLKAHSVVSDEKIKSEEFLAGTDESDRDFDRLPDVSASYFGDSHFEPVAGEGVGEAVHGEAVLGGGGSEGEEENHSAKRNDYESGNRPEADRRRFKESEEEEKTVKTARPAR